MYFDSIYPCSLPSNSSDILQIVFTPKIMFSFSSSFSPSLLPFLPVSLPLFFLTVPTLCYPCMGVRSCVQEPHS